MPSLTCFTIRFTPSWIMIFLTVFVTSLFLRLGFWQIQRANQKETMVLAQASLAKLEPIEWHGQQPLQYQRVRVIGRYLPDVFLLDNQHQQHQFGFDVISPLLLNNGTVVLIDRGWVPGDVTRRTFPQVTTPDKQVQVEGSVYFPSSQQWVLGASMEKKSNKLTILETLAPKEVSHILQKKVYPFIIRLNKEDKHGFVRQWAIVSVPPQRHLAYAWQWFAMAFVVFIIFIALNLKKNEKKDN
jgi:surfeit locus 1 family protein